MGEGEISTKTSDADLLRELLEEGLAIQDRFAAEPVFAKTGKGFLKSEGVAKLARIKSDKVKSDGTD